MTPIKQFTGQSKAFWACVRTISQHVGYSKGDKIIVPDLGDITDTFRQLGLDLTKMVDNGRPTEFAALLIEYFSARAVCLEGAAKDGLMDGPEARKLFENVRNNLKPKCPIPMNKQKGLKKAETFLTGLVNMIVEANIGNLPCCYDPRELTTITRDGLPVRTLARRVDGAFPSPVNPIAIWEIKEYYYTTTFGSRVADGVYESLLDGMELEDLRKEDDIEVLHYLIIDSYFTWWTKGKSYLCRIFDMLHMGYVDEVLFGKEVVDRLPVLAREWTELALDQGKTGSLPEDVGMGHPTR